MGRGGIKLKSKVRYIDLQEIVPTYRNSSSANLFQGLCCRKALLFEPHTPPSVYLFINRLLAIQGFKVHKADFLF